MADRAASLVVLSQNGSDPTERSVVDTKDLRSNTPNVVSQGGSGDTLARARRDLSEAQKSKGLMQSRLDTISDELQKLKLQSQQDARRINELQSEKTTLSIRMKDQDEELAGKAKLLEVF